MSKKSIKTLLLVEDNPGDARLLREMFNEQGSLDTELTHVSRMSEAEKHLGGACGRHHPARPGLARCAGTGSGTAGPRRRAPRSPGGADGPGRRVAGRAGPAGRRARLSHQGPDRDARAAARPALCHRAQDHGRGAVRGKGTRPGHAQLHRRRRRLHGHLGKHHLPQSRRGKHDGLVAGRKRLAGPWPKCCASWTPQVAKPSRIRWRWRLGETETVHLPSNCILIRRDGFEIPIEDSVAPIHDREGQATGAVIVFRDVSAARAMALQIDPFGRARLSDRFAQSHAPERPDQPGDRLGAASQEAGRGAVPGSGRLQAHQRFPGASDRRQASSIHRQAPGGLRARLGHGEPAGRRRIRRAAFRSGTIGRCRHYGEKNAAGGGGGSFHRPARSSRHHQHRRERLSRRRPGCGDAHQERGHRDVPGEGERAPELSVLQAGHERPSRGAAIDRGEPAARPGAAGIRAALPAEGQSEDGSDHRGGSVDALDASHARTGLSGAVHSRRGRLRPHSADRRLGPS